MGSVKTDVAKGKTLGGKKPSARSWNTETHQEIVRDLLAGSDIDSKKVYADAAQKMIKIIRSDTKYANDRSGKYFVTVIKASGGRLDLQLREYLDMPHKTKSTKVESVTIVENFENLETQISQMKRILAPISDSIKIGDVIPVTGRYHRDCYASFYQSMVAKLANENLDFYKKAESADSEDKKRKLSRRIFLPL